VSTRAVSGQSLFVYALMNALAGFTIACFYALASPAVQPLFDPVMLSMAIFFP
jgi:hypothetical protein